MGLRALAACRAVGLAISLISLPGFAIARDGQLSQADQPIQQDLVDPEKLYGYAKSAAEGGDIPTAIAALERLLRLDPTLDNARLQLGALYLQIGSYGLAELYIEQALRSPTITAEVRTRATDLLKQAKHLEEPNQFTGTLSAGIRYDTNVNNGPISNQVSTPLGLATIQPQFSQKGDFSFYAGAQVADIYDFGDQRRTTLVTNATAYSQTYSSQRDFDLGVFALDTGPNFRLGEASDFGSLRPYAIGSFVGLGDSPYFSSGGGGIGYTTPATRVLVGQVKFDIQHQDFYNSSFRPTNSNLTGNIKSAYLNVQYIIDQYSSAFATFRYTRDDAITTFQSNNDRDGLVGYTRLFDAPFRLGSAAWSVTASARYRDTVYDAPDPSVSTTTAQHDRRFDGTLSLLIPISGSLSAQLAGQITRSPSNLPNFAFNNEGAWLGVSWNF